MPPIMRGGGERIASTVEMSRTQRWREERLKSKWLHINEEVAIRKTCTVKKPLN